MDYKEKIEEKRQKLVNTLIEFIENNPTQWEAGWYKVATEPPFNGKSEKAYKGLNAFYLCVLSMLKGYRDPRWVTFKQAKELGGNVKSGEKSSEIFYWSFYDKATKKPYEEKTCEGMTKKERLEYWEKNVRPVIKFYQVFNAEQCENLPEYKRETTPEMEAEERQRQNAVIEQIIANSDAPVNYDGGNRAYYSPAEDSIHLPEIKDFKTMQDYYATALHEIAHSTGHESRLNRNLLGFFGTADYAKEELRAELASVFMQVEYGISIEGRHFENHGAYLAGWLKSVKDNKNEFYAAATDAEKITGYIADNYLNAKSESKEQQQTTPKFEANNSFARQVDAVLSGADTTSTHLKIMGTPLILRQLGAQNLPVLMTAKHLKNIVADSGDDISVNYHGIDVDLIKKLPELLSDPVMVMDSLTKPDSVVIVTSAVNKENRPIIGAIKFDGFGREDRIIVEANILTSVYGKDNFESFVRRNIVANNILYWNKEKSQELSVNPGFQLPDVMASLDSDIIIRKAKAFVNSLGEKNENIPVDEAKKAEKSTADVLERASKVKTFYLDYEKTQKENPEAIVLKRLGDFYEAMGDKAAQVAATLDLTLTGRDVGLSDRVAMCGFPYHVADEYIAKLRESSDVIVDNKYLVKRMRIKSRQAQEQEILEEARKVAHEAGLPFSDKLDIGEEDFNPNVYDGSMSIEDYNLMNEMIAAEQVEQVGQVAPEQGKKPTVVNFYAGPGAGKTTAALELTAELKKAGLNVEYVSEYAKELVLEGKTELLSDQQLVTDEQYRRLDRLRNSVDVIVTDSPVLLGIVYGADRIDDAYRQKLRSYYDSFDNIDIYLERRTEYDTHGRVQTEQEAVVLDNEISQMLKEQNVNCYGYSSDKIAETVQLVELSQEHRKMRAEAQKESDLIAEARIKAKQLAIDSGEPYITINWSEHSSTNPDGVRLDTGKIMPLSEADKVLEKLNADFKDSGYAKTKLDIDFVFEGELNSWEASRFDIGTESGGLVAHIADFAANASEQNLSPQEYAFVKAMPKYLSEHIRLSKVLNEARENGTSDGALERLERQIKEERQALNAAAPYLTETEIRMSEQAEQVPLSLIEQIEEYAFESNNPNHLKKQIRYEDLVKVAEINGIDYASLKLDHTWNTDIDTAEMELQALKNNLSEARYLIEYYHGNYNQRTGDVGWWFYESELQKLSGKENVAAGEKVLEQAKAAMPEQVKQVRQVGQAKWQKITIEPTLIGAERGKSTMLRMPEGEYSSFVLFVPTKFIQQDEKSGLVQLSVNDNFNYSLMKGNQRVELSGSELCQAMAGKEVGKRTQRVLSEANAENLTNIYRNIPEEMRQYPNWCVYRTRWNEEKGKYDKQIYSPVLGLNKDGKMQWASVDKPETWATFDVAMKFAEDNDCAGLVFALDGKTGISCIDLDKAIVKDGKLNNKPTDRADGEMSALALRLSNELKNTYIETSASGNGLHIFVKDDLLAKGTYKNRVETADGEIEVYDDKRFMSMTGKLRSNTQRLNKCPVATTAFLQSQLGEKTALQTAQPRQSRQVDNSDNAVIERIRRSKRGTEFDALYKGEDLTGDNSRNDFKMLNMLAFFTDCDESQMERIFKSSALYRAEKSDAYVQHSVKKACATLQTRMSNRAYYGGNKKSGNNGNSK